MNASEARAPERPGDEGVIGRWLGRLRAALRVLAAFVVAWTIQLMVLLVLYGVFKLDLAAVGQDVAPDGSAVRGFASTLLLVGPAVVLAWAIHRRWTRRP